MNHSTRIVPALTLALALVGCSTMGHSDQDTNGKSGEMHQAEAPRTERSSADSPANCAPDRIGSAAGQGSDCRNETGGATSTPPDSSNSNDTNVPTTPPPR